ncbi:carbohydrate ABC transporter membrane protein 1, CUT1 family [Actinomadura meyerae]|uniref:Carbohydrate ABC transporter membrane protein 1, CUT1 family n=1 Tax=Actinomadura meyerae TaxID=240840 RepID=A0A239KD19_9ACTN|nr:sugar ABC transporter permease [Actinomadura meyerae]SNT15539.1 carbohydrate ABC transporter membrane protein 1, CUT1 family [Actinomadura meyerae]
MTLSATTDDRPRHAAGAPRRRGPKASAGERLRGWASSTWFLLPALLLFFFFVLIPIFVAFYTSFFRWGGFGWPDDFTGLENYRKLADDPVFRGDLWRGLLIIVFSIVVQLPIALGTAVLLNQKMRGRAIYRAIFFAPYILSEVIAGVLFGIIFLPDSGLADTLVEDLPLLGGLAGKWFSDPDTALPTLFAVMTWKYFGFHMMIYLAGLQGIPSEVLEAASIDGAGPWRRFRSVTLPLLGPTLRISVFLSVIGSLQLFDLVWVTTTGGPTHSTETMAVTMFQFGFKRYQMGYAGAISVAMFLICMVFSLLYQRYALRRDLQGAVTNAGGRR